MIYKKKNKYKNKKDSGIYYIQLKKKNYKI